MKFEYQAIDAQGNEESGIADANDFADLLKQLCEKQLYPIDVRELSKHSAASRIDRFKKIQDKLSPPKKKKPESTSTVLPTAPIIQEPRDNKFVNAIPIIITIIALILIAMK